MIPKAEVPRRDVLWGVTVGAAAISIAGILSACSGSSGPNTQGSVGGKLPDPSPLKGVSMQGIINDNIPGEAQAKTLPLWEKKSGMKVNFQLLGEGQVFQKVGSILAGGKSTEVGVASAVTSRMLQWQKAEWIVPIDAYLADPRYTPEATLDRPDFYSAFWDLCKGLDGKMYGFPFFAGTKLLAYRRDIFEKYSLSPPDTIDDLVSVCKTLKSHGVAAIAMRGAAGATSAVWPFLTFFYGEGASLFVDFPKDLHLTIASKEAVHALEIFTDLLNNYSVPGVANFDFPQVRGAFLAGQVAMILDEAQGIGLMHQPGVNPHAANVSTAVVPKGPAGRFAGIATQLLVIPKGFADIGAAYRYNLWLTSSEGQLAMALQGNVTAVTRASVFANKDFQSKYNYDNGKYLKNYQTTLEKYAQGDLSPAVSVAPQIMEALGVAISSSVAGGASPAQALKEAEDRGNQIIKQAGLT